MSNPDSKDVYVDEFLSNILIAYMQDQNNFGADKLFPTVDVQRETGIYIQYDQGDFLRSEAKKRGPAAESAGTGFDIDKTGKYNCEQYSIHEDIDPRVTANQMDPVDVESAASRLIAQKLLIRRERDFVNSYFKTGVWDSNLQGGVSSGFATQWNDGNSTPVDDITNEAEAMVGRTGFRPNKAACDALTYNALRNHPDVLERIKYTERGIVTPELLASLLDLDEFIVMRAVENTAVKGAADSVGYIAPNSLLLVYTTDTPSIMVPSAGYTFAWTGLFQNAYSGRITRMEMPLNNHSVRIEGDMAYGMEAVATPLGSYFYDTLSTP